MKPSASPSCVPPSRAAIVVSRALDVLLLALCAGLVALSYYGFTLYCESFGCLGRGLVWALWAALAAVGWVVAAVVRAWQRHRGLGAQASGLAWALLSVMGAAHLLYWVGTTLLR